MGIASSSLANEIVGIGFVIEFPHATQIAPSTPTWPKVGKG